MEREKTNMSLWGWIGIGDIDVNHGFQCKYINKMHVNMWGGVGGWVCNCIFLLYSQALPSEGPTLSPQK